MYIWGPRLLHLLLPHIEIKFFLSLCIHCNHLIYSHLFFSPFISSPSYMAALPRFLLFKRFFIFIKKYIRVTINYIKSKMEEWLQNIEQKTYTKVIEKLWFSLNVHPILSLIFQILLDTKMHYTKNKLHRTLYTSETTFSSAGLNLYCCIFSPFS